jgi:hypothetical protein
MFNGNEVAYGVKDGKFEVAAFSTLAATGLSISRGANGQVLLTPQGPEMCLRDDLDISSLGATTRAVVGPVPNGPEMQFGFDATTAEARRKAWDAKVADAELNRWVGNILALLPGVERDESLGFARLRNPLTGDALSTDERSEALVTILSIPFLRGPAVAPGAAGPAAGTAIVAERGISVLGRYPAYIQLGEAIPSRTFRVPTWVWNKMSPAEQWAANVRFLDRLVTRGDEVYLATRASNAVPGTFFYREIEYLTSHGYTISDDGWRLLPPER